jgi:hypothetical protein
MITSAPCKPGFICDYRAPGAYPACFDRLECIANGNWNLTRSSQGCQKPLGDPSCPTTFAARALGSDCDPAGKGACFYDEGTCGCVACSIGGPPTQGEWVCQGWDAGGPGCPSEPPLAGDACATPDIGCAYGQFGSDVGLGDGYSCIDGFWTILPSVQGSFAIPRCPQTMTCGFTTAPVAPDPAVPGAPAEQAAPAAALAEYDALIGRFLRGDATVYSGDFDVSTLERGQGAFVPSGGFKSGGALASLDVRSTVPDDWWPPLATPPTDSRTAVLVVHSLIVPLDFVLAQRSDDAPGTTWLSGVRADSPTAPGPNPLIISCAGCLPSLTPSPDGLLINGATVMGMAMVPSDGGFAEVQLRSSFDAQLDRVDPCALRWRQLATLATTTGPDELAADPGLRGFVDSGDEMVKHIVSSYTDRTITRGTCGTMTSYTIDLWVKKADLGAHGVRNYNVTSAQMICGA